MSPDDLKSVLWFKSYSIISTKLVLKPQGVNLGRNEKKPLWGIFVSVIFRHKIENRIRNGKWAGKFYKN